MNFYIPNGWQARELADHLVEDHNVPPDRLIQLREMKNDEEWIDFLEVGHRLLHEAEESATVDDVDDEEQSND